jgi:iron complex transport system substrate-binding protein
MRFWVRWLMVAAGLFWLWQPTQALQVRDERGVTVTLAQPPQRIVSLLPSLTEMVCALNQCKHLVGVDRYSNYPASVRALPTVGGGLDPQIEAIVALRPDLVLLATSSPAISRLEALGLRVVAVEPKTHDDVRRALQILGAVLAVPDAMSRWADIEAGLREAAALLTPRTPRTKVYFEVNSAPYAAGEASFIGETLARLGVDNIVPRALGPFPRLNPEFVVRANPDMILVGDSSFTTLAQRPGWSSLRAVAQGRYCVFSPEQSDVMVRPGPRMAEAARLIAQCIRDKRP